MLRATGWPRVWGAMTWRPPCSAQVSPIHKAAFRVPKGAVNLRRATGGLLVRVVSRFLFVQVMYFDLDFYGVVSVFSERFCDGVAIGDGLKGLAAVDIRHLGITCCNRMHAC